MTDQVKVRFFTNEEDDLKVSENPIFVPVSLKRYGLSEIVNHLLNDGETKKAIPFDFLVDGVLLRTSLQDYLTKQGLSTETVIDLQYTRAVLPPSFLASFTNEDWISSIDTINPGHGAVLASNMKLQESKILSGSYDGVVRTYNMSGEVESQYIGHLGPVKSVRWISPTRIVSAGNDHSLRLWKTKLAGVEEGAEDGKTTAILEGHKGPVVDLAVDYKSNKIISAGNDSVVGVWSTNASDMSAVTVSEPTGSTMSKKRKKLALQDSTIKRRAPLAMMDGHGQPVTGVCFDVNDNLVIYSASQDHTIKTWDLVTSRCVDTRSTGFSLLSILQLPNLHLVASGSSARHINLHDPRASSSTEQVSRKLVGHTNFVVSMAACPDKDHMFASASHDGTVKVWDVRADKAMYTLGKGGKVFGVSWDPIGIVSGGEDKKIDIYREAN